MNKIHVEYSQAVFISCVTFLIHGQAGRSTVWANGTQNLGLVNFVPESRLPFVQISSILGQNDREGLNPVSKMALKKWITDFRLDIPSGKTGQPFQMFRCSRKFSDGTTQKV